MSSSRRSSLSLGISLGFGHRSPAGATATTAVVLALLLLERGLSTSKETNEQTGQKQEKDSNRRKGLFSGCLGARKG